jgi:hypothetical protein
LIRHARPALAAPVLPLPVAMILPALETPLMPAIGVSPLPQSGGSTAVGTAITLAAITVLTDPEHGMTAIAETNPLTQNHFALNRHLRRRRGLDNGRPIMSG